MTERILEQIDRVLTDTTVSRDAMRQTPDPPPDQEPWIPTCPRFTRIPPPSDDAAARALAMWKAMKARSVDAPQDPTG